jgi:hypothetical protein
LELHPHQFGTGLLKIQNIAYIHHNQFITTRCIADVLTNFPVCSNKVAILYLAGWLTEKYFCRKFFMPKKPSKQKSPTDIETDLKKMLDRKKSENEALKKLLHFVEKNSGKEKP